MRQIDLKELRTIQLEILSDVDAFCKKHQIRYSLCGGTLLGAVRHQGYIPWDDDIDLMMPRPDFDYFAQEYKSKDNELLDLRKSGVTVEICLKVSKIGTIMTDTFFGRTLWGINIDIFPIDGAPIDYESHCERILKLRKRISRICPFYKTIPRQKIKWFTKYVIKRLIYPYRGSILDVKREIEEIAHSYSLEQSPKAGVILGSYGKREVVNKSVFDQIVYLPFEGFQLPAISNYDTYLSAIYGDYMVLPPMDKRITHHYYDSFIE